MKEACCISQVGKESPQKKERKMTTDSHEGSHSKDTKENGIQGMSQKEFDKEFVEIKENLDVMLMLLEGQEEDQRKGWTIRRKEVRWHSLQVKLRQRMVARLREKLRATEFKMQVVYCEPEEGDVLREGYEEQGRLAESLMDSLRSSYQHDDDVLTEDLDEDIIPHKFYFYDNPLFVVAGEEIGQLDETVMQFGEGGHMIFESMTTTQDMDVIEEMDEDEEVHWCEPEQN
jgi:hypothetical protein